MKHLSISRLLLAIAVVAGVALAAGPARAEGETAQCRFIEIRADNSKGGIDGELKPLERKLRKPPFSSWNTFKVLAKHDRALSLMKAENIALSEGKAQVLFRERNKTAGKKDRVSLAISVDGKDGKRALDTKVNVDSGDFIVIGRSLPDESGHLLAISCRVK